MSTDWHFSREYLPVDSMTNLSRRASGFSRRSLVSSSATPLLMTTPRVGAVARSNTSRMNCEG